MTAIGSIAQQGFVTSQLTSGTITASPGQEGGVCNVCEVIVLPSDW